MEDKSILLCINAPQMRDLLNQANEVGVCKEDIVQILYLHEEYWLVYQSKK